MRRTIALLSAVLACGLAGCSLSPLAKRAAAFAPAAAAAAKDTTAAYVLVEQTHQQQEIAAIVTNFDQDGFSSDKLKPFVDDEDMAARKQILDGLAKYAETLAWVSGDQPMTEFDTQAAALGKSLQSLAASDNFSSLAKKANVTGTDINIAATAVDALGRVLIERRRGRELPAILKQMDSPIQRICALLDADFGSPQGSGLRNQLHNDYRTMRRKQERFIRDNEATMSASEKRAAIEELPKLVSAESAADLQLACTQSAVRQLAAAHTALVASIGVKESPAFRTTLSELIQQGEQLHSFYAQLPGK